MPLESTTSDVFLHVLSVGVHRRVKRRQRHQGAHLRSDARTENRYVAYAAMKIDTTIIASATRRAAIAVIVKSEPQCLCTWPDTPSIAADTDPTVTAMLSQCRNVRSFAAHQAVCSAASSVRWIRNNCRLLCLHTYRMKARIGK